MVSTTGDSARAQVNEFAEVCSGLSVTLPVIQPLVGGLLGPIIGLVNTGIVDVLSGETIGVKILDEDGDILGDGACKVEADGFAVDNAQGITIGGGQINGLGGTGNALASAGHATAIAFGNGALTAAGVQQAMAIGTSAQVFTGATGAIALGSSAETSIAGSVALGQGSVGVATSLSNGTVTTSTGPVDLTYSNNANTNAGSVSVGTTSLRRQLKNVADGSDAHDAATVGQLAGVVVDTNTALNAAETSIDTIGSGLATSLGGSAAYNTGTNAFTAPSYVLSSGTFSNVGAALLNIDGRTATNTTAIATAETAFDNLGSGLATTFGGGAAYNTGTNVFTAPSFVLSTGPFASVNGALVDIDGRVVTNTANIATNTTNIATNATNITNVETSKDSLGTSLAASLGGGAAYNTGNNVFTAPSFALSSGTYTNVNGALVDIDGRVVTNTANIATNTSNIATNTTNIATNATNIANVETSKDSLGASLAASLGGGAAYDSGTNVFTGPSFVLSSGAFNNVDGALLDIDGRVVINTANIATNTANIATNTANIATNTANIATNTGNIATNTANIATNTTNIATNATNIANVETSKDNLGASLAASLGGGAAYDSGTNVFTGPSFVLSTGAFNNVDTALLDLDGRVAANTTNISTLQTDVTNLDGDLTTLITQIQDGEIGLVQQDGTTREITVGAGTDGTLVSFFNANGDARVLDGIANGALSALSLEAVNGSQLFATNTALDGTVAGLGGGAAYDPVTSVFTGPSYVLSSGAFNNVGSALLDLDGRVVTNTNDITTIQGDIVTIGGDITDLGGDLTTLITQIQDGEIGLVQQDAISRDITVGGDTDGTLVSFFNDNGDPRLLDGVADGALSALSVEAINGSQLFATNTALDGTVAALGGGATYDPLTSAFTAPSYVLSSGAFNNVGSALLDLDGRVVTNTNDIADLFDQIEAGEVGLVRQEAISRNITVGADTDGTLVDLSNDTGDARTLTGVADGALSALSLEAVNGSQLFATNSAVDAAFTALGGGATYDPLTSVFTGPSYVLSSGAFNNVGGALLDLDGRIVTNANDITTIEGDITAIEGDITNLGGDLTTLITQIQDGEIGLVQQDAISRDITVGADTDGTLVDFSNDTGNARTLAGVADGTLSALSLDAVNGSQLFAANSAVDAAFAALGGGAAYDPLTSVFTGPSYVLSSGAFNNVGGALLDLDGRVVTNTDDITTIEGDITTLTNLINSSGVGLVTQDTLSRDINVGAATDGTIVNFENDTGDARTLTGVADGALSGLSLEAVNGSQLFATNTALDGTVAALGGGAAYDPLTSVFTGPSYVLSSGAFNNVGGALLNLDGRVVTNTNDITTIQGDIVTIGGDLTALTNLVNGSGIGLITQDTISRDINVGAATDGTVVNFENDTGTARTLTGVADGALSTSSTEAVNGSQLFSTNSAVEGAYTALGGGASFNPATGVATGPSYSVQGGTHTNVGSALTALDGQVTTNTTDIANLQTNINNGSVGLVRQDAGTRVISVGGTTDGTSIDLRNNAAQARTVSGVANGQIGAASSEAVNGSQIHAVGQSVASALGGGTGVLPNGTLSAPSYAIEGNTYNNVGSALAAVDSSIGDLRTQITNISSSGSPYIAIQTARPAAVAGSPESLAIGGGAQANGLNSTAVGHAAVANGAGASAFGYGANAGGTNSMALGAGASAAHNNAVALGAGASTTRDNQIAIGSGAHTYTMAGIASTQSRAAQSGAVQVVTSDSGGNLATASATDLFPQIGGFDNRIGNIEKGMSVHADGIAMALALGGAMAPPDGKTFAISGNVGLFEGAQAMGFSAVGRLDESWFVNASVGMGFSTNTVGGRLGATYSW
jgi:autotransporter adhesin